MPIFEYQASDPKKSCEHCRERFEHLHIRQEDPLKTCPDCGNPVTKLISAPSVGASQSSFDDRAKAAGFSKLKKLGKGEYEKQY